MNSLDSNFENASFSADDDDSVQTRMENDDSAVKPFSKMQKMAVKFLLSNIAAGVIIGKGGTNITDLQQESNARIQLSRNNEFYPGTNERVMLISGTVKSVLTALFLILTKLAAMTKEANALDMSKTESLSQSLASSLKIVMPAACCGAILGKGGKTVRQFVEDSGASIVILTQTYVGQDMDSRVISISGSIEQMLRAVALVITKVAADPKYINNVSLSVNYNKHNYQSQTTGYPVYSSEDPVSPYSQCSPLAMPYSQTMIYPGAAYSHIDHPPVSYATTKHPTESMESSSKSQSTETEASVSHQGPLGHPGLPIPANGVPRVEMSVPIPDEKIGAIIGRGGAIITQLQTLVGVKIIISGRNEFEPGTRNRRVTIIGPPEAVQIAHMLISMKERSMALPQFVGNWYN
eukprot:g6953.t1